MSRRGIARLGFTTFIRWAGTRSKGAARIRGRLLRNASWRWKRRQRRWLPRQARVAEEVAVEAELQLKFWRAETCQAAVGADAADFPTSCTKKFCTTRSIAIRAATF